MKTSEQINELSAALAKAQGEIKGALKDSSNPFFKSTYADLGSVWDACRGPLSKNGLAIIQVPDFTEAGNMVLYTMLTHSSGQYIQSSYLIIPVKNDPQGMGSAISYARRYSLAAMVGIYQVDDDGNVASCKVLAPYIKEVREVPNKPMAPKPQQTANEASKGPHEHKWVTSRFKEKQEYCSICKETRDIK